MHLELTHDIVINEQPLDMISSVRVEKDINQLADKATIMLSALNQKQSIQLEKRIKRGYPVRISLGYNGDNTQELEGFVRFVRNNEQFEIECEDNMFNFHKEVKARVLKDVSVVDIVQEVINELGGYTLVAGAGVDGIRFDTFTVEYGATAYKVLSKVKQQSRLTIYLRGKELHMQLRHLSDQPNLIKYDFSYNVEKSSLKHINADEVPLLVEVTSLQKNGTKLTGQFGKVGGDKFALSTYNVTDQATLNSIAESYHKTKSYTGVDGDITTWLTPYITVGNHASITDPEDVSLDGAYLVEKVVTDWKEKGGSRIVGLTVRV